MTPWRTHARAALFVGALAASACGAKPTEPVPSPIVQPVAPADAVTSTDAPVDAAIDTPVDTPADAAIDAGMSREQRQRLDDDRRKRQLYERQQRENRLKMPYGAPPARRRVV